MSKWTSESGILRKRAAPERPEELLVFGYACKLFRDDEKALYIDQGKHLIPWMGNDVLKIDRYDCRGALSELDHYEAGSEDYDARRWLGLSDSERRIEQLCDEERYYSLKNNEEEEELYKEEELKRLQNSNSEFQYNYDVPMDPDQQQEVTVPFEEEDEDFVLSDQLKLPEDITIPKTVKENARIEKTALFVSKQGPQMEILIKAKQSDNPQFGFMNQDDPLFRYYKFLLEAIKNGSYKIVDTSDNKEEEPEQQGEGPDEHYLHPSLSGIGGGPMGVASPTVQSVAPPPAPPIYRPSADCAYTQLVNRIQSATSSATPTNQYDQQQYYHQQQYYYAQYYEYYKQMAQSNEGENPDFNYVNYANLPENSEITRSAILYGREVPPPPPQTPPLPPEQRTVTVESRKKKSLLPMLANYGSSDDQSNDDDDSNDETRIAYVLPPRDVRLIIDKMALYVSKNGKDFEDIVRAKFDPRFEFLNEGHEYHPYYIHKTSEELRPASPRPDNSDNGVNGSDKDKEKKTVAAPVSFSIKKPKEDVNKDIKSALPLEESDEEMAPVTVDTPTTPSFTPPLKETTPPLSEIAETDTENLIMEMIDLTDDTEERKEHKRIEDRRKDKIVAAAREKLALQLERKRKAAVFLRLKSEGAEPKRATPPLATPINDEIEVIGSESEEGGTERRKRRKSPKKKKSHKSKYSKTRHRDHKRKKRKSHSSESSNGS